MVKEGSHWSVYGSMPAEKNQYGHFHRNNVHCEVVTKTAGRAIALVEEHYPGVEVHSVQHRGKIGVIDDEQN